MKKILTMVLILAMILSLSACNNTPQSSESVTPTPTSTANTSAGIPTSAPEATSPTDTAADSNILIAYFTNPEPDGVDAVARASRVVVNGEVVGNTQFIAQIIQSETGGTLFAIETVQEYPPRPELMEIGQNEKNENARPELSTQIDNLEDYDIIFIGYPNWNADMPMALYTFLETYDFNGKTIIPFCPHGGSGFSNTIRTIADLQPNATVVTNGYSVSRDGVPNSENAVRDWVKSLNLADYSTSSTSQNNSEQGERYLNLTLNGAVTVSAVVVESPATEEFLALLPITLNMHEHMNRQKEVYLSFSLSVENQVNTVHVYEVGDIVYWHPGPTMGIFYTHDGRDIRAGIEILARLDAEGIEAFATTTDNVEVLIELATFGG